MLVYIITRSHRNCQAYFLMFNNTNKHVDVFIFHQKYIDNLFLSNLEHSTVDKYMLSDSFNTCNV